MAWTWLGSFCDSLQPSLSTDVLAVVFAHVSNPSATPSPSKSES